MEGRVVRKRVAAKSKSLDLFDRPRRRSVTLPRSSSSTSSSSSFSSSSSSSYNTVQNLG